MRFFCYKLGQSENYMRRKPVFIRDRQVGEKSRVRRGADCWLGREGKKTSRCYFRYKGNVDTNK